MKERSKLYSIGLIIIFILTLAACNKNIPADSNENHEPVKSEDSEEQFKDSIKLQFENENFTFHSLDKDKECIEDMAKVLDESFDTITGNLGVTLKEKTKIVIYPNIKSFHNNIGTQNAGDWLVGTAWRNEIYIVSPLNPGMEHTYDTLMKAAVHEFVHVVQYNIYQYNYPYRWMNDGLATYLADQVPSSTVMKTMIDGGQIPTLSDMNKNFLEVEGYAFSYTVVEYLVKEYGYETIVEMIKSYKNIETILGKSLDEFEKDWINYLKENWGRK